MFSNEIALPVGLVRAASVQHSHGRNTFEPLWSGVGDKKILYVDMLSRISQHRRHQFFDWIGDKVAGVHEVVPGERVTSG